MVLSLDNTQNWRNSCMAVVIGVCVKENLLGVFSGWKKMLRVNLKLTKYSNLYAEAFA